MKINRKKNRRSSSKSSSKQYALAPASSLYPRLDTGLIALNKLTGGGIRCGTVFEFRGIIDLAETQLLALQVIKAAQAQGFVSVYIDTEGAVSDSRYYPSPQSKYQLRKLGLAQDDQKFMVIEHYEPELELFELIEVLLSKQKCLIVIDNLPNLVFHNCRHKPGCVKERNQVHCRITQMLTRLLAAARLTESIILILNDQHVSQMSYTPTRELMREGYAGFPMGYLSGICELKLHQKEKHLPNNYPGKIIKARMLHSPYARASQQEFFYVDQDAGYSNIRTLVKIAQDQGVISNASGEYHLPYVVGYVPQKGLHKLEAYLCKHRRLQHELVNRIDWSRTHYDVPRLA